MNEVFSDRSMDKLDFNTRRQIAEKGWRKASEEEKYAFLGYYLNLKRKKSGFRYLRFISLLLFVIAAAELAFEYVCKDDPSYHPFPILACMFLCLLLILFSQTGLQLQSKRYQMLLSDRIYVISGMASVVGDNQVQVILNEKTACGEPFTFNETVSPMDYIYDEQGLKKGFYVRLFLAIDELGGVTKTVLGSYGFDYYLHWYSKKIHRH